MNDATTKPAYGLGRAARLNLTLEILNEVADSSKPLDSILSKRFHDLEEQMERRDRRDLESRVYSVLNHFRRILWWIEKSKMETTTRSMVLCDMVLNQNADIDQLQKLCNGSKNRMEMLNRSEIAALKTMIGKEINHTSMSEAILLECPDWAEQGLRKAFGDQFSEAMKAFNEKPSSDFRVNTLKSDRAAVQAKLANQGFKTEFSELSPFGLKQTIPGGPKISETDAFRDGEIEIQDEGSQLVGLLVDARPGMQVVDFCAGAGGKSLVLAQTMENSGHLVACDVHSKRLQRAKVRMKRAGVVNAERRVLENTFDKWIKKSKQKFDRVLIDAPCSGSGTWRRNPDSKWTRDETDLAELVKLQGEILESASRLTKIGGRMIYATCSLLPEENEDQIEKFLKTHNDFKILPIKTLWEEKLPVPCSSSHAKFLRLSPYHHNCDGFFAAILERQ